jgi:hypothetical protein
MSLSLLRGGKITSLWTKFSIHLGLSKGSFLSSYSGTFSLMSAAPKSNNFTSGALAFSYMSSSADLTFSNLAGLTVKQKKLEDSTMNFLSRSSRVLP